MTDTTATDTTATDTTAAMETTTAQLTRRGGLLLRLLLVIAVAFAGLGLSGHDAADAASFSTPTIRCGAGQVRLNPGVQATYGQTDGYWFGHLFRYTASGWQYTGQVRQGRESASTAAVGGTSFSGLGSGYYAVVMVRYNHTSRGWQRLPNVAALEYVSAGLGGSTYWCRA